MDADGIFHCAAAPDLEEIRAESGIPRHGIAALVIAVIVTFQLVDRLNRFPGQSTALRLLTTASSNKSMLLDPVKTNAGALGDYLFMKHRLAHYDVPPEFADLKTIGCRMFDDEEGQRVAQIWVVEKKMQFFLFPAERDPKTGEPNISTAGVMSIKTVGPVW